MASSSWLEATGIFSNVPIDWFIIAALALLISAETLRAGSNKAASLALALPLALLAFTSLPSAALIGSASGELVNPHVQAALFLGLVAVAFFFTYRIIGFYSESSATFLPAAIAGIATTALLVVFWLQIPALSSFWSFGPQVHALFSEAYRFWWLIAGYVALAASRS